MTAKPTPIIDSPTEAGDQAMRDELYAAFRALEARIELLEARLDLKIEQLIAKRDKEEGQSPS
jgi:phage baseplate assembly protein W